MGAMPFSWRSWEIVLKLLKRAGAVMAEACSYVRLSGSCSYAHLK